MSSFAIASTVTTAPIVTGALCRRTDPIATVRTAATSSSTRRTGLASVTSTIVSVGANAATSAGP